MSASVLDAEFAAELVPEKLWTARLACSLAAVLYGAFGIIDQWMIPSALHAVWALRAGVVLMSLAVLALTWHEQFLRRYSTFALLLPLMWAGGIEAMLYLATPSDPARDFYYAGLILVVIGFHNWFYLPIGLMVAVSAAIVAAYALIAIFAHDVVAGGGLPTLVSNLFFLVSAVVICVATQARRYVYLLENFRWRQALARDVEATERARRDSEHRARHDPLTGLPNRDHFLQLVGSQIEAARSRGSAVAVMFVDLDGFKPINDAHGHAVGDEVLKIVAQRMRHALKGPDTIARIGGDEFAVACTLPAPGADAAGEITGKLLAAIASSMGIGALHVAVTASIGVALFPRHGADVETLLAAADRAMYEVKHAGKAGVKSAAA